MLATDAALVAAAAWLVAVAGGHARRGVLEAGLAWGLAGVALVAGTGVVLGATGGFGPNGFLALHAGLLVVLLALRHRSLAADAARLGRMLKDTRGILTRRTGGCCGSGAGID
jgi:hypothetical protein